MYQCNDITENETAGTSVVLLQSFADPASGDDEEDFYCCVWSRNLRRSIDNSSDTTITTSQGMATLQPTTNTSNQQQVLAVAGKRGVIRLLCPSLSSCMASLVGHGQSVNELKFHPKHPALLFSFSKGEAVCSTTIPVR